MTPIWRKFISLRIRPGRLLRHWNGRLGLCLLHGLTGVVVSPGCAWVRAQAQHRSAECEELCAKADREQEAGRISHADMLLDEALKKSPRDVETQRQLADSLWQVGRQREALLLLTEMANQHPHDLRLSLKLAERCVELERYDDALRWVGTALISDPKSISAMTLKANIELAQGRDAAALATYQRISQQEAGQAAALLAMGEIHLHRGQPERAAPLLRSALAHSQATAREREAAEWQLGIAYAQAERWEDATATFSTVASRRKLSPANWHELAYAAYRSGQLETARTALDHALFLEPGHVGAITLAAALNQPVRQSTTADNQFMPANFERMQPREASAVDR